MCIGEIECVLERECVRERVCVICKRILGKTRKSVDLGEREREKERVLAGECYLQKSIIRTEREKERALEVILNSCRCCNNLQIPKDRL